MYRTSKDYDLLFSFLLSENEPLCYLDYQISDRVVCRDIARIRRHKSFEIKIGVRGLIYGYINKDEAGNVVSEKELFIKKCIDLNLEWVCPNFDEIPSILINSN